MNSIEIINQDDNPLVSIIVITYNSSKFVLETLESAKAQTYQNIELIISDDCSTDNTVEICRQWLEENKERFVRIELIAVGKNTGIPANCNRGIKVSTGEWVKMIAGDDALKNNCITENISVISKFRDIEVLQTNLDYYQDSFEKSNYIKSSSVEVNPFFSELKNAENQYRYLLYKNPINAPSVFIKKKLIINLGGYDEDIQLMEDLPLWIKATKNGNMISCDSVVTVNYRLHSKSVMKGDFKIMSIEFAKSLLIFSRKYKQNNVSNTHYYLYNLGLKLRIIQNKINSFFSNVYFNKACNKIIFLIMNFGVSKALTSNK